jgi:hypothetical protein
MVFSFRFGRARQTNMASEDAEMGSGENTNVRIDTYLPKTLTTAAYR